MDQQPTGIIEESPGVKSSKRLMGVVLVSSGAALLVAIGVVAIFRSVTDSAAALDAGKALIWTGAALLGVGVLEGIGSRISAGGVK